MFITYEQLAQTTQALVEGLTAAARSAGVAFSADAVGAMFGVFFANRPPATFAEVMASDRSAFNTFFHAMLREGVYFAPSAFEAGFVSAAHGAAEIDQMMKVIGEEGTSLQDFILYLKAVLFDAVYLQQNAFDEVDAASSETRQIDFFRSCPP